MCYAVEVAVELGSVTECVDILDHGTSGRRGRAMSGARARRRSCDPAGAAIIVAVVPIEIHKCVV